MVCEFVVRHPQLALFGNQFGQHAYLMATIVAWSATDCNTFGYQNSKLTNPPARGRATVVAMMEGSTGMAVGEMIKALREERGLSQGQLAEYAKVTRSWLSRVELGSIARPDRERLARVAGHFRLPPEVLWEAAGYRVQSVPVRPLRTPEEFMAEALIALRREREQTIVAIPVEGVASAGPGAFQDECGYVRQAEVRPELRMLTVTGSCMKPLIQPSDVVIVDTEASYRPGSIIAATRGDQVIVKRFYEDELRGDDGTVERAADWTIVGVVITLQRPLE